MAKNDINSNFNQIAVTDASDNVLGIRAAVGNVQITGGANGQVLSTNGSGGLTWATAGGSAIYAAAVGFLGSTAINAGSITFNTISNGGFTWLSVASRYGVGTRYGVDMNGRNLSGAGAGVYGGTYGIVTMPAAAGLFLGGYYAVAGAKFDIVNAITGETWLVDLLNDQIGSGAYNKLSVQIPNPVDPTAMNSVIAALLTTNQAAFNSAAAGVAVEITAAEYAALVAGVPNTTKFGATDAIMATPPVGSSNITTGGYSDGDFAVEAQAPAQRYIYAFTTRVVTANAGQSGTMFVHTSQATGSSTAALLGQVHNNSIAISNTDSRKYWAVKNAQYRRFACYAASWVSVNHYKFNGPVSGAYKFLLTTGPADGSQNNFLLSNTGNMTNRPFIQLLAGTPT